MKEIESNMTTEQAIKLMQVEMTCIKRASNADNTCTRECEKCDLIQKSEDLIAAYNTAINALRDVTKKSDDPLKVGKWIYFHKKNKAVCSNCSFERDLDADFGKAISCPNCGIRMDERKELK